VTAKPHSRHRREVHSRHRRGVVVLDYGSGNLRSAQRALQRVGADVEVTADAAAAMDADGLVVPGVGAFEACMTGLRKISGDKIIADRVAAGRPVLGVCVGMQILFARGVEFGLETTGCGQWPGAVVRLDAPVIPHMGWNVVDAAAGSTLFKGIDATTRFYFVHSYAAQQWEGSPDALLTWATHHVPFLAAVEDGPLSATQFHPEKSGDAGAALLANWVGALG
jgi:glutamine amidotransferase